MGDITELVERLPIVKKPSKRYILATEFAKRAKRSHQTIQLAVVSGHIPEKHCVAANIRGRKRMLIDWEAAGYDYIFNHIKPEKWPGDFVPNDSKSFRPDDEGRAVKREEEADNLNDAKLKIANLEIKKKETEQLIWENKLLYNDDMLDLNRTVAAEVKSEVRKAINKMAPDLLACNNVGQIKQILERGWSDAIRILIEHGEVEHE